MPEYSNGEIKVTNEKGDVHTFKPSRDKDYHTNPVKLSEDSKEIRVDYRDESGNCRVAVYPKHSVSIDAPLHDDLYFYNSSSDDGPIGVTHRDYASERAGTRQAKYAAICAVVGVLGATAITTYLCCDAWGLKGGLLAAPFMSFLPAFVGLESGLLIGFGIDALTRKCE